MYPGHALLEGFCISFVALENLRVNAPPTSQTSIPCLLSAPPALSYPPSVSGGRRVRPRQDSGCNYSTAWSVSRHLIIAASREKDMKDIRNTRGFPRESHCVCLKGGVRRSESVGYCSSCWLPMDGELVGSELHGISRRSRAELGTSLLSLEMGR